MFTYGRYTSWSGCSKTCGKGISYRIKLCNFPFACSGSKTVETKSCVQQPCGGLKTNGCFCCFKIKMLFTFKLFKLSLLDSNVKAYDTFFYFKDTQVLKSVVYLYLANVELKRLLKMTSRQQMYLPERYVF